MHDVAVRCWLCHAEQASKTTFHLVAVGTAGKVLVRKKFTQEQLLTFTATMETSLIGMEACSRAHFLARALRTQGHDVRLIPAQFVKPFVKSNKNNFIDAEAIAEAVERKKYLQTFLQNKKVILGMGLGSTSQRRSSNAMGSISIKSAVEQGSTIRVFLPIRS